MPESFGRLSWFLAIVSLLSPLMAMGLNGLITRELLRRPGDTELIIGTGLIIKLVSSVVSISIALIIAKLYMDPNQWFLFAVLLTSSIVNAGLIFDSWLQAKMANRYGAQIKLAVLMVMSSLRLYAVFANAELSVFVYLCGLEFLLTASLYIFVFIQYGSGLSQLSFSLQEFKYLIVRSRWLLFSGIAAMIYLKIDQIMLGHLLNDYAVGVYALAAKFSEVWYFVPAAIVTSYFPSLVEKRSANKAEYHHDIQKLNDILFMSSTIIASLVSAAAWWILPAVFGELYIESISVLVIHIWAAVFVFMRSLLSKWLLVENFLRLSLLTQLVGAVVNIVLNYLLIPRYGPIGAAYATVISYSVAGYFILFFHRDLRPMALVVTRSLMLPYRLARHGFAQEKF